MLLDTSGLIAFHHQGEPNHLKAVALFESAKLRLTHSYVLAEFVALANARKLLRRTALEFVHDLLNSDEVETLYIDQARNDAALDSLKQRLDKSWSLCDAVSFLLMQERGITEALSTDHHFEQAGFTRLLSPAGGRAP